MKSVTLSSIVLFLVLNIMPNNLNAFQTAACETECTYQGCDVTFNQDMFGWSIWVYCPDDGSYYYDTGSGDYTGTICGGTEPCDAPLPWH